MLVYSFIVEQSPIDKDEGVGFANLPWPIVTILKCGNYNWYILNLIYIIINIQVPYINFIYGTFILWMIYIYNI